MSLAVPQGVRRGILAIIAVNFLVIDSTQSLGMMLLTGMYAMGYLGVYRTIVQARAPKEYTFGLTVIV